MATKIPLALGNQAWDMMATAQQIDQCCGLGRGINLLDNWWFGSGVINQRGGTTYNSSNRSYCIDRWWRYGRGNLELVDSGLHFMPSNRFTIAQNFNRVIVGLAVPVVASIFYIKDGITGIFSISTPSNSGIPYQNDGIVTICYGTSLSNYGGPYCEIGAVSECIIVAAKLEIGTEQTLAHLESDTWVLNDPPPNQALELLKCQRYQVFGNLCSDTSLTSVGTQKVCFLSLPIRLHKNPTIVGNPQVYSKATNAPLSPSLIEVTEVYGNGCILVPRGISEDCYIKFPDNHSGLDANL